MIHVKVDVTIFSHPKFRAAGLDGVGLWLFGLAYSRQLELDGFIPDVALAMFGEEAHVRELAERLVSIRLWTRSDRGGYLVAKYGEKNQTKKQIEASKAEARERMKQVRASRSSEHRSSFERTSSERLDTELRTSEVPDSDSDSEHSRSLQIRDLEPGTAREEALPSFTVVPGGSSYESGTRLAARPAWDAVGSVEAFTEGVADGWSPGLGAPRTDLSNALRARIEADRRKGDSRPVLAACRAFGARWRSRCDGAPKDAWRAARWLSEGAPPSQREVDRAAADEPLAPYHRKWIRPKMVGEGT